MRQAVMTSPGMIELRTVAEVTAGPGQVLMRIQRIGVCGSDVHVNPESTRPWTTRSYRGTSSRRSSRRSGRGSPGSGPE